MKSFSKRLMAIAGAMAFFSSTAWASPAVEYFVDSDPGIGNGTVVESPDPTNPLQAAVDVPVSVIEGLADGPHVLGARVRDEAGAWSIASYRVFFKGDFEPVPAVSDVVEVEYFVNSDPGQGVGDRVLTASEEVIAATVNIPTQVVAGLPEGLHKLAARVRDADGNWSAAFTRAFLKGDPQIDPPATVVGVEYQIYGNSDPAGAPVFAQASPPADEVFLNPAANLDALAEDRAYKIVVAPIDSLGRRGIAHTASFLIVGPFQIASIAYVGEGSVRFTISNAAGLRGMLQTSVDLVEWIDLQPIAPDSENFEITATAEAAPARFFRILVE